MSETFYLFEYGSDGFHNGSVPVEEENLESIFNSIVVKARDEKRTIIITDKMDMCVFHMENGEIIHPKPGVKADS